MEETVNIEADHKQQRKRKAKLEAELKQIKQCIASWKQDFEALEDQALHVKLDIKDAKKHQEWLEDKLEYEDY